MHERPHNTDQRGAEVRLQPAEGVLPLPAAQRSAVAACARVGRPMPVARPPSTHNICPVM